MILFDFAHLFIVKKQNLQSFPKAEGALEFARETRLSIPHRLKIALQKIWEVADEL